VPTAGDIAVRSLSAGARNFIDARRFVGLQTGSGFAFREEGAPGSRNRDAEELSADSGEVGGVKVSHKFCWKFFAYVFPGRHQHGALLDEGVRSPGISVW
jgi:hypothetical protein